MGAPDNVILPLAWDGSTLSIPRASSIQDGYLSKDTFVLFSGGTVVPVTSFNNRTGEVILWEDDVLAALGYVPMNKHGDTMTGPLTLAGDPTLPLHAATRQYVLSQAAGSALPSTWLLSDFKASGSKLTFTGSITAGSSTLTLTTSAHDFAVGQGIGIQTAGNLQVVTAGSNLHVTRITAISGATITLANPAINTATSKTVQHDDTVALQTALDTVAAASGGTILADRGWYRLNGPLTNFNSIIKLPYTVFWPAASAGPRLGIALICPPQGFAGYGGISESGAIFQTDRIGTDSNSSMFACALWSNNPQLASGTTIYIKNATFLTYPNPAISALDFGMAGNVICEAAVIACTTAGSDFTLPQPTHGTFGLRSPIQGTGTSNDAFDMLWVAGYGIGIIFSEAFRSTWFVVNACNIAMQSGGNYHQSYGTGQLSYCPILLQINSRTSVDMNLDFQLEANSSVWWYTPAGNDIVDTGNNLTGVIKYSKLTANLGTPEYASVTGAERVTLISMDGLGTQLAGNITNQMTMLQGLDVGTTLGVGNNVILSGNAVTYGTNDTAGTGFRPLRIPNSPPVNLTSGLFSHWKMDEATGNRADTVGPNTFSAVGTLSAVTGKLSSGASGTGAGYLSCADNISQHPSGSFTIAGWLLIHSPAGASGYHTLLGRWGSSNQGFIIWYDNANGIWNFTLCPTGATSLSVSVSHTPAVETWYHVAAIYDSVNHQIRLRVNDGIVGAATAPFPNPPYASTADVTSLFLGSLYSSAAVDELGWWNRALNSSEISALYNGGGVPPTLP